MICTHNLDCRKFSEEFNTPLFLFLLYTDLAFPWPVTYLLGLTSYAPTYSPNSLSWNIISKQFVVFLVCSVGGVFCDWFFVCFLFFPFFEFTFLSNKLFNIAQLLLAIPKCLESKGWRLFHCAFPFCCLQNWGVGKPLLPDVLIIN